MNEAFGCVFDDIVALTPRSAEAVGALARHIARRGILNLVGQLPLDGLVNADVGRLHYDYIAFVGGASWCNRNCFLNKQAQFKKT